MISVDEALGHIIDLVSPLDSETVPLRAATHRVLAKPVIARHNQPPFAASSMDGYAINADPTPGDTFNIIGQSAAGHGFSGHVGPRETVRIFTGAPVPDGATRVIIQEDVTRAGDQITIAADQTSARYIRPAGFDFANGEPCFPRRPLKPQDIALIAAMNHADVDVVRRPEIALIATGDELVAPGTLPGPDQIVASNHLGLAAMIEQAGGLARLLPIARDTVSSLDRAFDLARGADMVITIGGASVGDHDLVAHVATSRGMDRAFYKVAMRPGKPLMAGWVDGAPMIGLPGNPVSSMVCGVIFMLPALRAMLGLPATAMPRQTARLATALPANGPREHYMRATPRP